MHPSLPQPANLPCPECGASVARAESDEHVCDEKRRLDYALFQLREELAGLGGEVATYLDSPQGRFELYCAARERQA